MPIIIRNHSLSVSEIDAVPEIGYQPLRVVPVLVITVAYEVSITGMHTVVPPGFGYRERVQIKDTYVSLSSEPLPLEPEQYDQTFTRKHTALVEKRFITNDPAELNPFSIQARITVALEPEHRQVVDTNIVKLPGARYRTTAAVATIANAAYWVADQLFGRSSPDREG